MTVTMSRSLYESLRTAILDNDQTGAKQLLKKIDKANGLMRYTYVIRWLEASAGVPRKVDIWKGWPPEQQIKVTVDQPMSKVDVENLVKNKGVNPVGVQVTADPNGVVGWYELDVFPFDAPVANL